MRELELSRHDAVCPAVAAKVAGRASLTAARGVAGALAPENVDDLGVPEWVTVLGAIQLWK